MMNQSKIDSGDGQWCSNRSLLGDDASGTATSCQRDSEWFDSNIELKELFMNITLGLVLAVVCSLTIVGNALVLHAVRTERKLQTVR